jgi:hypothetical protein
MFYVYGWGVRTCECASLVMQFDACISATHWLTLKERDKGGKWSQLGGMCGCTTYVNIEKVRIRGGREDRDSEGYFSLPKKRYKRNRDHKYDSAE